MKIGVLRALYLGDLLCTVPAWRALRRHYPRAQITLIGLPWSRNFQHRFHRYADDFLDFPGWPGLPEQAVDEVRVANFLTTLRRRRFDLLIQMQGDGTHVNALMALCEARRVAGYYLPGHDRPDGDFWPYPPAGSEIHRWLGLMQRLGCRPGSADLEFPINRQDEKEWHRLGLRVTPKAYVVIHPGARDPRRRWDPAGFAAVGNALGRQGYTVVLTGVAAEEQVVAQVADKLTVHALTVEVEGHGKLWEE